MNWNAEDWKALISERQLLSWLVKVPTETEQLRSRQITASQINRLEELWKVGELQLLFKCQKVQENPEATLEDLDRPGFDNEPDNVQLRYEDAYQYRRVFQPLVRLEAEYDRKSKEALTQAVGHVRFDIGLNKKVTASFHLPEFRDGNLKLMIGDQVITNLNAKDDFQLKLKHHQTIDGSEVAYQGRIVKIPDNFSDEFSLEMAENTKMPTDKRTNYVLVFIFS